MVIGFFRGFAEAMRLSSFRGPWAYQNMAEIEAKEPESAFDLGALAAVIMVRADEERRLATRRQRGAHEEGNG
jgi:hypothetical protein